MSTEKEVGQDFEDEVRRIARAKWPAAQYGGAAMLEGRERDGVFETEESVHFVEATISAGAGKAKEDTKKLFRAISEHNKSGSLRTAQGWFVTKHEPTADQRKEVSDLGKGQVRALSFSQFQQSLVDVRGYLSARHDHRFGSVQNFNGLEKNPTVPYVDLGFTHQSTGEAFQIEDVLGKALEGSHIAIVGQYGAGKSMTLRELFVRLEQRYKRGGTPKFPVYINLREHSGQRDPVEILERHSRNVGFSAPSSLIRAWRAGFVILLIDGFDEVSSLGVQGSWKRLKDLRMRSLEGVRRLIRDSASVGMVVCGRSHYFEDDKEFSSALGLRDPFVLSVDAFSESQVGTFLSKFPRGKGPTTFPDWLPTRPLLLGYLASRGLLSDLAEEEHHLDVIDGWDYLLERIYSREEQIETNLDGATLRLILERLATIARVSEDGLGPISRTEMFGAFTEICGYEPDEQGMLAIQRLPGLGVYRADDESRCFVDEELAAVCAGRDLLRFLEAPYEMLKSGTWCDAMSTSFTPIMEVGARLAYRNLMTKMDARGSIRQSISLLNNRNDLKCVRGDVATVAILGNIPVDLGLVVSEMNFSNSVLEIHAEIEDVGNISFSHCLFGNISIDANLSAAQVPYFDNCLIERVAGRVSQADLPAARFSGCEFISFESTETGRAIRAAQLSIGEKVLLITLRKLFVQSLSGRSEGALFRGLDVDQRRVVPEVLRSLKRHRIATDSSRGEGVIWMPVRRALDRVKRILAAPSECGEAVVREAKDLG